MTKGDLGEVVTSHIKGNSKASPSKGKGLVKGRGGGKKSSSSQESRSSPFRTSTNTDLFLNPVLKQSNLLASMKDAFSDSKNLDLAEEKRGLKVEVTHEPFTVGRLFNLLQVSKGGVEDFHQMLKQELSLLEFVEKNNDLYQFHQTRDLLSSRDLPEQPYLNAFKSILRGELKDMVEEMTGISLNDNIDLFCGKYAHTDYLLCHDDELEGRRIAFIFYLVSPSWSEADGGALDLFDTDPKGEPDKVVKSLFPVLNSFAFFPVNEKSYHQVAEVLSKDNIRLSLSGWFHGDSPASRPPRFPAPLPKSLPWIPSSSSTDSSSSSSLIAEWVSPMYFDANLAKTVKKKFGKKSEIQLENFIRPEKLIVVQQELDNRVSSNTWVMVGPANKSHYHSTSSSTSSVNSELDKLISVFRSEEMFFLLSHLTGLKIHPSMEEEEEEEEDGDGEDSDSGAEGEGEEDEEETNSLTTDSRPVPREDDDEESDDDNGPAAKKAKIDVPKISPLDSAANEGKELTMNVNERSSDELDIDGPSCHIEIRRWRPSNYTLLGDMSTPSSASTSLRNLISGSELDVSLCFAVDDRWDSQRHGGATVYVAKDEDDELLSIAPRHNALSLVFREKDTASFVKYINSDAPGTFFQIACGFKEIDVEIEVKEKDEGEEEEED